jgi:hypothetical protein
VPLKDRHIQDELRPVFFTLLLDAATTRTHFLLYSVQSFQLAVPTFILSFYHSSLSHISLFDNMLSAFITILALTGFVRGHGFITGIDGANGKVGIGFGVDAAQITVCGSYMR